MKRILPMQGFEHNLPVTLSQVLAWIKQCTTPEKKLLLRTLLDDTSALTIASEPSLAKDWSGSDEDEAWSGL
ncbi:MAG: hypothetical protein KA941_05170 [Flavobacteriales bacterium]|nr:hypothetical protein [Flavobacteriales bacterium]